MLSTLFSEVCGIVVQHCGLCGGKLGNLFEDASRADHRKGEGTKVNKCGVEGIARGRGKRSSVDLHHILLFYPSRVKQWFPCATLERSASRRGQGNGGPIFNRGRRRARRPP